MVKPLGMAAGRKRDIIGIGASAGGVAALRDVFEHIPAHLPVTIFAVLHRGSDPRSADLLASILGRKSQFPVVEPEDGERFVHGCIYLAPPARHMVVTDGAIALRDTPKEHFTRPALDPLFVSLAQNFGRRVLGIVLTGCGRDGVRGLRAISAAGGLSIAQDPVEAQEPSMPLEAIRQDDVQAILSLEEIPRALMVLSTGADLNALAEMLGERRGSRIVQSPPPRGGAPQSRRPSVRTKHRRVRPYPGFRGDMAERRKRRSQWPKAATAPDKLPAHPARESRDGQKISASKTADFPVVGIGASAGGLEALKEFFASMPTDIGIAFVIVQHLDPTHKSHMRDVLARYTNMQVVEPEDQTPIQPNVVYTIPPNTYLGVHNGKLVLSEPVKRSGMRMPIDFFFRSLAEDRHEHALAVLLSGSGSDGTLGLREIRGAGGIVIVQDPSTAKYEAMPQSAILTGLVDRVLPVNEIPSALVAYVRGSSVNKVVKADPEEGKGDDLNGVLSLVATRTKSDFRCYKKSTIRRRIQRQMGLHQISNVGDYLRFLRTNPEKVTQLAKDMLIGVTSFFRDADTFEELRQHVVAPLVRNREDDGPIRVWVPGCATGEEAYSIAMLFLDEMAVAEGGRPFGARPVLPHSATAQVAYPLQIFASDVDEEALKVGRIGMYPESIATDIPEDLLSRFFTKSETAYQINKQARETVTFAVQNLVADPPFSKLDLVSCRNVLIYFETEMQKRVAALFAYALNPGGYLFLGKSDGIAGQAEFFTRISTKLPVYRRTANSRPELTQFPSTPDRRPVGVHGLVSGDRLTRTSGLSAINQQVLLAHFHAAAVIVDRFGTILNFFGDTSRYLDHPTGDANLNLFEMTHELTSVKLRNALREAAQGNVVAFEHVTVKSADATLEINVTVRPIDDRRTGDRLIAVIFEQSRVTAGTPPEPSAKESADAAYGDLIADLSDTKEELQTSIEELEASNEELKAANEEVTSINEELQSTNEELETSKEELQSLNEELTTVNNQLQEKVDQLGAANSDMANLFAATDVATIFLDQQMQIRRYTPALTKLMRLIPSDVGRPVADISHDFVDTDLAAGAAKVLRDLDRLENEVRTQDNRWYSMRIMPYRTLGNKVDGAVITFHDVTRHKENEQALKIMKEGLEKQIARRSAKLSETHSALVREMEKREHLAHRLTKLQEDERQRIARELHDSTAQNLAGLGMNLALIERSGKGLPNKIRETISESTELIHAVMREVRTVSYLLHPPLLEEVGLVSAVRTYVEGFAKRSGRQISLAMPRTLGVMPLAIKSVIFGIIQESLTNIHHHSGSAKARIRVQENRGELQIEVRDDGRGLPTGMIQPSGELTRAGVGISSMQARVQDVGGQLKISSAPGSGVTVVATVPLKPPPPLRRSKKNKQR